jgi:hypothetical protein
MAPWQIQEPKIFEAPVMNTDHQEAAKLLPADGLEVTGKSASPVARLLAAIPGQSSSPCLSAGPVLLLWGILSSILLAFALHCWPVLDGDAINFVPNMVTYANNRTLVNAPSAIAQQVDLLGGGRLIHHGFLYEMVVGRISFFPTYSSVILTMALIEILSLGACAFVLYRAANTLSIGSGWLRLALVFFGLGGTAAALLGLRGRPEPFGILLVASAGGLVFSLPWRWHFLVVGGALGLLAATSPPGTLLCSPIAVLYASAR